MIKEFQGEYRWLSNFAPIMIRLDDLPGDTALYFKSTEAAYQASKSIVVDAEGVPFERLPLQYMPPGWCKRAGRDLTLRADWDAVKLDVMYNVNKQKYANDKYFLKLINTGEQELIEGNKWGDCYWGKCGGFGQNHLGKIIMRIRDELVEELKQP